jgi:hypothetical protein
VRLSDQHRTDNLHASATGIGHQAREIFGRGDEIVSYTGLASLVLGWPEPTTAQEREDQWFGLCWKARTVVRWAARRPFAWVDDEITDADRDWVSEKHLGPALLRSVDASRGLTD